MSTKTTKCYHCGGVIGENEDIVMKKIPLHTKSGIRKYNRKFHTHCASEFVGNLEVEKETGKENSDWSKCYEYFKDLLGIKEGQNLDEHATLRILGTRVGRYVPSGMNVRGLKRGYDFEVILTTMKFCSVQIRDVLGTMQFKDQKHKIDYMMKIITNNLNFVAAKVEGKRITDKKMDIYIPVEQIENLPEYNKKSIENNKIKDIINTVVKEDDDMEELMSLF